MGISKNSKSPFSLREKDAMRVLKSSIYTPHSSPLPEGEGIFRDSLINNAQKNPITVIIARLYSVVVRYSGTHKDLTLLNFLEFITTKPNCAAIAKIHDSFYPH
jgi:hypothetical protein